MLNATARYKVLVTKNQWQRKTPDQEKIAVLETKLNGIKSQKVKFKQGEEKKSAGPKGKSSSEKPDWLVQNLRPKASEINKLRLDNVTTLIEPMDNKLRRG